MEEKTIRAVVCHTPGLISIGDSTALDAFSGQEIEITIRPVPRPKRRWWKFTETGEVRVPKDGEWFIDSKGAFVETDFVSLRSVCPIVRLEIGEVEL